MSDRRIAQSPAFGCYLLALAVLPLRWLSPIGSLYAHADWTDVLVAVTAVLWLIERLRDGQLLNAVRWWQLPLLGYIALACVSAAAESGGAEDWKTVLLIAELAVLATVSADFASQAARRRVIARVIVAAALATAALGALGLILFYARVPSGLVGVYGQQFIPSHLYTRVQAGFESPPLLASFCIFASGVTASEDAAMRPRLRTATQISLGLLCAATLSRGLIGFLFAAALRRCPVMRVPRRWIIATTATLASLGLLAGLTVGRLHLDPLKPSSISYVVPDPGNRREAFVTSLKTFGHHPLLGSGPGSLPGLNAGAPFRAHFTPLNVAATLGLPAVCALTATLVLLWRRRRRPTDVALWSAFAGICIDGLAQDIDHFRHVWILLGLLGS